MKSCEGVRKKSAMCRMVCPFKDHWAVGRRDFEYAVMVVIVEVNHMTHENVVSSPITICH